MGVGPPKRVYTIEPIRDPIRRIQERPAPAAPRKPARPREPARRERVARP
jgi:hypothetical protein